MKIYNDLEVGRVDNRVFSSFIEHLGRAVYTGIYEPTHPTADASGFREDVIELVKDLNIEYVRYPGGNFVSGYRWKDGVGEHRPKRIDYAWRSIESNIIGINEFSDWCNKTNTKIMGAVNVGTGTPQEAADFVEYCNFPGNTELSDWRKSHGYEKPHNIDIWCIGNEMDGEWQTCQLDATDYGKKALETAKMIKWVDSSVELVLVGSSNSDMETYPMWDRKVLEKCWDKVDYISLHKYFENEGDNQKFLLSAYDLQSFIDTIFHTVQYVKALKRSDKEVYLSLDEWNVWNYTKWNNLNYENLKMEELQEHPNLLEDEYTYIDTIVFASLTQVILNNADKVKIACLAQLVNVIAPIMTRENGPALKQGIYYPFELFSKFGRGTVLETYVKNEQFEFNNKNYDQVITTCVRDDEKNELNVFVTNLSLEQDYHFEIETDLQLEFIECYSISNENHFAKNSFDNPNEVTYEKIEFDALIKPCSYKLYRYKIKQA